MRTMISSTSTILQISNNNNTRIYSLTKANKQTTNQANKDNDNDNTFLEEAIISSIIILDINISYTFSVSSL
jgi:hypothetical protein